MGIFDKLFGKRKSKNPEDDYKVTVTEELILVEHPRRKTEQILWKDITEIKLINTDEGPWLPDVWLTLLSKDGGCLIPQGAIGYDTVYDIVSKYDGFDFENVIKSMSCTDNMQFQLWTRTKEIRHTT
jgi:hypothetical protein